MSFERLEHLHELRRWPTDLLRVVAEYVDFHFFVFSHRQRVDHYTNGLFTHSSKLRDQTNQWNHMDNSSYFVVGKLDSSTNIIDRYDDKKREWSNLCSFPRTRTLGLSHEVPVAIEDHILVLGNEDYHTLTTSVYDLTMKKWSSGPSLPLIVRFPEVVVIGRYLYVLESFGDSRFYRLNVDTGVFNVLHQVPENKWPYYYVMVVDHDIFLLPRLQVGEVKLNGDIAFTIWRYCTLSDSWYEQSWKIP